MKKTFVLLIIMLLLFTACSAKSKISLDDLPDSYSLEDAKEDNCIVFENGDITSGQSIWDNFVKDTGEGRSTSVRLAFYYNLDDDSNLSEEYMEEVREEYPKLYMKDLNYDGEKYVIEGVEKGELMAKKYKYLIRYEGKPHSKNAAFSKYTYYVLVNDNTVTWDDIEQGMLSSQSNASIDHYLVYSDFVLK